MSTTTTANLAALEQAATEAYERANGVTARRAADIAESERLTRAIETAEAANDVVEAEQLRALRSMVRDRLGDYERAERLAMANFDAADIAYAQAAEPEKRAAVMEARAQFLEALNALLPFARVVRAAEAEHRRVYGRIPADARRPHGEPLADLPGSAGQVLRDIAGWPSV